MPRHARDEKLDTRTARLRLAPRHAPYWRNIQEGRAIGYRRAVPGKAGQWQARFLDRDEGGARVRRFLAIGSADDFLDPDDIATLNFAQAQARAHAWFEELSRKQKGAAEPITVAQAMSAYLADYKARGGKAADRLENTIDAHILPSLGGKKVAELTHVVIRKWLHSVAASAPRVRTKKGASKQATREVAENDPEAKRARRASANRILTVLKAALNLAFGDDAALTDEAWRRVSPFKKADAARVRFLTDAEAIRLVNAAEGNFRSMVQAALLTGARWGELVQLRAEDFSRDVGALHIRISKTGKPRHIMLTDEGRSFVERLCAGKSGENLILPRADGEAWKKSEQHRPIQTACKAAKVTPAIGFHILRHTYASRLVMLGVPLGVVAAQLGNSQAICEKHYAHLSPGFITESIRAAFTPLGIVPVSNVATLEFAT